MMPKYNVTRHEISSCVIEAKNRKEAISIGSQLGDEAFEREDDADYLWAEMVE